MTDQATHDRSFEVLHAVRVKGLTTDAVLADFLGVAEDGLAPYTGPLVDAGLLLRREGRFAGHTLTPAGKEAAAERLTTDTETRDATPALARLYDAFLPVNGDFKRLCERWQVRDGQPNDHTDAAHDQAVFADLHTLHDAFVPVLREADLPPRIRRYADRLDGALARIGDGETGAFARPMNNSYHDIWMELHEDLIVSGGRVRDAHDEG
ncbi:hypothetical protein QE364_002269 [Nocardioides zeae]|uniref:Uncharacterized protein n=1 Tax=Nocardioides zeae TaxID=1457234 RepID=A0ACC6IIP3_9ACTN|nr:hypothetical protein [Nocardioides zeae]MDR6174482.1 hypothetical protein [Nocardioides zeae]MDR6210554.1 hypothetical protein [Nocardioides zeae]